MILPAALALWAVHGVLLYHNRGRFRPRIALLHGLALAAVGGVAVWLGAPPWALYAPGALVGVVGGWGHPLAPGLWVGVGLLWFLPQAQAFALAAQLGLLLVAVARGRPKG